jgi:hypothetical protein
MSHVGQHRAGAAEARVLRLEARLRRHDVPGLVAAGLWWAAVVDWVRLLWRDLRLQIIAIAAWWSTDNIPTCVTCQRGSHRACGIFADDPPCGCGCEAAARHRMELAQREGWGN